MNPPARVTVIVTSRDWPARMVAVAGLTANEIDGDGRVGAPEHPAARAIQQPTSQARDDRPGGGMGQYYARLAPSVTAPRTP